MAAQDGPWRPPAQTERDDTEPTPPPPDDIHTAWVLWMAAAGFALVGMLLNALTSRFERCSCVAVCSCHAANG